MRSIFRCMMEDGYYPTFEKTHILFDLADNTAVVEYEEGVLSVRIFFSIDEDAYDLFLEASNVAMLESFMVKPAILEDMRNIMFSFEMLCDTQREFKKIFPRGIELLKDAIRLHKAEMKKLADELAACKTADEFKMYVLKYLAGENFDSLYEDAAEELTVDLLPGEADLATRRQQVIDACIANALEGKAAEATTSEDTVEVMFSDITASLTKTLTSVLDGMLIEGYAWTDDEGNAAGL